MSSTIDASAAPAMLSSTRARSWTLRQGERTTDLRAEITERVGNYMREKDRTKLRHDLMVVRYLPGIDPRDIRKVCARLLSDSMLKFTIFNMTCAQESVGLPEILRSMQRGHLVSESRQAGILPRAWPLRLAVHLIFAVASFLFVAQMQLNAHGAGDQGTLGDLVSTSAFWMQGSLLAIAAMTLLALTQSALDKSNRTLMDKIARHIATKDSASNRESIFDLIKSMMYRLEKPIAVIVPHFDRLDSFTRDFFKEFLGQESSKTVGSVLWIMLEPDENHEASRFIASQCPHASALVNAPANVYTLSN